MSLRSITPRTAIVVVAAGFVLFLALGWMTLIGPQREEAAQLESEIEATRVLLAVPVPEPAEVADAEEASERLVRAMPDRVEMPGVVLDLHRLAGEAGVRLDSITPGAAVALGTYQSQPITVTLQGSFFGFSDFLRRLRSEARVTGGEVQGEGRLYAVDSIGFAEGQPRFPNLTATLTISTAFAPSAPPVAAEPGTDGVGAVTEAPGTDSP